MEVGHCFLLVSQHALGLRGVKGRLAPPGPVAWRRREEVQVVAEKGGDLQSNQTENAPINRRHERVNTTGRFLWRDGTPPGQPLQWCVAHYGWN